VRGSASFSLSYMRLPRAIFHVGLIDARPRIGGCADVSNFVVARI
jgi:hypothetical protein